MKTLEEICQEHVAKNYGSFKHFTRLANDMDTTTGEGKKKQVRFRHSAQDYYQMASAIERCLTEWSNQEEVEKSAG